METDKETGGNPVSSAIRMLAAMPIEIRFAAHIVGVFRLTERAGQPIFVPRYGAWSEGERNGDVEDLNAFELRDAFLNVKTPTEALHFLTTSGFAFSWREAEVTWNSFRRWQSYARAMHLAPERRELIEPSEPSKVALDHDQQQMARMVFGAHHEYFPGEIGDVEPPATRPKQLARGVLSHRDRVAEQAMLEQHFVSPNPETFHLIWDEERPSLIFNPRNTLEAIGAAIHADRMAGKRFTQCEKPRCGQIILLGAHDSKRFCSRQCMDAARKQRHRKHLRELQKAI